MRLLRTIFLALQLSLAVQAVALPATKKTEETIKKPDETKDKPATTPKPAAAAKAAATPTPVAKAGPEFDGSFGKKTTLKAGPKTGWHFKTSLGNIEVDMMTDKDLTFTVTENKDPKGTAPTGFKFLDPNSYTIAISDDGQINQVDYIFTGSNIAKGATARTGKLVGGKFVFEGENIFDKAVSELKCKVKSVNGEWAIFTPDKNGGAEKETTGGTDKEKTSGTDKGKTGGKRSIE
ncbi:hypothetical protein HYFRA_00013784 [Hymenoscyphus fraxineus]|uniref:Uncharacterized protein n=1 Tax=Hymenoscyphus fraxineus TaxID=746836 RepID=A0A9N9LB31_9HELO|nr:hypothetical protein HYFRA_00013784 [Hymenoscyphus fraxineus]